MYFSVVKTPVDDRILHFTWYIAFLQMSVFKLYNLFNTWYLPTSVAVSIIWHNISAMNC